MTTKITKMDVVTCQVIERETKAALQEVAKKFGLTIKMQGGKYDPTVGTFAPKVEFAIEGANEKEFVQSLKYLRTNRGFGANEKQWLFPEDLGVEFKRGSDTLKLVAIHTNRPKYPFECEIVSVGSKGKRILLTEEGVMQALGRSNKVDPTKKSLVETILEQE